MQIRGFRNEKQPDGKIKTIPYDYDNSKKCCNNCDYCYWKPVKNEEMSHLIECCFDKPNKKLLGYAVDISTSNQTTMRAESLVGSQLTGETSCTLWTPLGNHYNMSYSDEGFHYNTHSNTIWVVNG